MLRRVGSAIESQCRSGDTAYRYGGEEFLIILPEQDRGSGSEIAERLRRTVEGLRIQHEAKDPPGVVTISLGVSVMEPGTDKSQEMLLKEADEALYQSKRAGRNRVHAYSGDED